MIEKIRIIFLIIIQKQKKFLHSDALLVFIKTRQINPHI